MAGDPSTSRVGGTDVNRITGHMAAAQPRGCGGYPRIAARPPALWSSDQLSPRYACSNRYGSHRRPRLGHGLEGDEVLVRSPPHAARRYTRTPRVRALRTAAPRIRGVGHKQSPPPRNQAGQLTARHRQQRPIVSVVHQFVEQVEPVPHRLPENLTQNPVHSHPSPMRLIGNSA